MAKLLVLPGNDIISGFKGVIDYYVNYQACDREVAGKGIPCARRWPRSPGHIRSPAVMERWSAFRYATSNWNSLSPEIQDAWRYTAQESGLTGRDLFTKAFITDYFREGQWQ